MSAPLILLYNLDNPRGSKLRRMCLPLKLRTRLVSKEEYALPLSVLAEGDGRAAPHPDQDFDDEMLLLCGLDGPPAGRLSPGLPPEQAPAGGPQGGAHPDQPGLGLVPAPRGAAP